MYFLRKTSRIGKYSVVVRFGIQFPISHHEHPTCATESTDIRKEIEMVEGSLECLHPSQRKTSHRTMIAIRNRAESGIDKGNQSLRDIVFECGRHIANGFHHLRRAKRLSRQVGRSLSSAPGIAVRHNHDHWLATFRGD